MNNITKQLAEEWNENGVERGDILLVHSSTRKLLFRFLRQGIKITPNDILESFLLAIGDKGTLLLPLFNFDFTKGITFDIRNTPSQMGFLTEAGRLYPRAVRTGHPIYSFAVIGRHSADFKNVNNFSGYGKDSPFGMLHQMKGKIAILDLPDQNSMTFYHYVEEMHNVSYRYHKRFKGQYVDWNGESSIREYGLFVRDIERKVMTHVTPMGEILWEKGLYKGVQPGTGCGLRVVCAHHVFDETSQIIRSGLAEGILYKIGDK